MEIARQVKKLLRHRKKHWNMFISISLEQYRSSYCETKNACKALISRTGQSYEKQLARHGENSLKKVIFVYKEVDSEK